MRILVVNDDGIGSAGICCLADLAMQLGEVWVAAPEGQCSAMSHRISVYGAINVKRENDFPVRGVRAYRIGGTPSDCVKVALDHLMPEKPDLVFSGINHGYNVGVDILYSGTVGAAMEALVNGIPAMAFSSDDNRDRRVPEIRYFPPCSTLPEKRFRRLNRHSSPETVPASSWSSSSPALGPSWLCRTTV